MKKHYLVIFFLLSCVAVPFCVLSAQSPAFRQVTNRTFSYHNGKPHLEKQNITEYNERGMATKIVYYAVDSLGIASKESVVIKEYDKEGKVIGTQKFNGFNTLVLKEEFFFDPYGKLTRAESVDYANPSNPFQTLTKIDYDAFGNKAREQSFNNSGELIKEEAWKHNEMKDVQAYYAWEYLEKKTKGTKISKSFNNTYDEIGNLTSSVLETNDGKNTIKEERSFSNNYMKKLVRYENGKEVSRFDDDVLQSPNKEKYKQYLVEPKYSGEEEDDFELQSLYLADWATKFEYDDNGKPISGEKVSNGKIVTLYNFEYTESGKLKKTTRQYKDIDLTEEMDIEYDSYGNQISESVSKNGKLSSKMVYSYEYYR